MACTWPCWLTEPVTASHCRIGMPEIAESRYVPAAMPGIVFLSGGQKAEEATANLNAMNKMGRRPWEVSFSYGRALQAPVLAAWKGQESNMAAAQQALKKRARLNGLAREGKYSPEMEAEA